MTDESRPADDLVAAVAALNSKVDDYINTQNARSLRGATGTIGGTFLPTPPTDALSLNGQTVLRSEYPALWQYVETNGLAGAAPLPFGVGDGSTTFVLPDAKDRALVHMNNAGGVNPGAKVGANNQILTEAQMPSHNHTVNNHNNHNHPMTGGSVPSGGNHIGHFPGAQVLVASGPNFGVSPWNSGGVWSENHGHGAVAVFSDSVGLSAHVVGITGTDASFDNRPASLVTNWFIWT